MLKQALKDYEELERIVANHKGTFEQLCEQLQGFNLEEELFDCNFKSITTTIINHNGIKMCEHMDIWDDENGVLVEECIFVGDLRKKCE